MRAKYIAGSMQTQYLKMDTAVVFDELIDHSFMAKRIGFLEIYSAGFVDLVVKDDKHLIECYGSSTSLGVESSQKDAKLIARSLGLQNGDWTDSE